MKRLNFKGVVLFFVSLLLFASCLGEGRNVQSGSTYGVTRYDYLKGINLLDVTETESFYSIRFNLSEGGIIVPIDDACFLVSYELDYDLPENSTESVVANGYYTVTIYDRLELDKLQIFSSLGDTSKALTNEVAIVNPIVDNYFTYIKGKSFVVSTVEVPSDQKMNWSLSYDYNNMVSTEGSATYCDVYLRATIRGYAGTNLKDKISFANAFDMEYYLKAATNKVNELGKSEFKLRFYYPSIINDEGQITWGAQYSQDLYVSSFISEGQ